MNFIYLQSEDLKLRGNFFLGKNRIDVNRWHQTTTMATLQQGKCKKKINEMKYYFTYTDVNVTNKREVCEVLSYLRETSCSGKVPELISL